MKTVIEQAKYAKDASVLLRKVSTKQKNDFLVFLAKLIEENISQILKANAKDLVENKNITSAMQKRLELTEGSLRNIAGAVRGLVDAPLAALAPGEIVAAELGRR